MTQSFCSGDACCIKRVKGLVKMGANYLFEKLSLDNKWTKNVNIFTNKQNNRSSLEELFAGPIWL